MERKTTHHTKKLYTSPGVQSVSEFFFGFATWRIACIQPTDGILLMSLDVVGCSCHPPPGSGTWIGPGAGWSQDGGSVPWPKRPGAGGVTT